MDRERGQEEDARQMPEKGGQFAAVRTICALPVMQLLALRDLHSAWAVLACKLFKCILCIHIHQPAQMRNGPVLSQDSACRLHKVWSQRTGGEGAPIAPSSRDLCPSSYAQILVLCSKSSLHWSVLQAPQDVSDDAPNLMAVLATSCLLQ